MNTVTFTLNGAEISVPAEGTLLTALRERLPAGVDPVMSVKDGCAPQGQCGCCTVWVDGEARVSCVTPVVRVAGRSVTTLEGVDEMARRAWSEALCATGGSQCGFCTPGIIMRLENLRLENLRLENSRSDSALGDPVLTREAVNKSLLAHLCRCTGWQTIHEAVEIMMDHRERDLDRHDVATTSRDLSAASRRAAMEGHSHQTVHPRISLGDGGFADDIAPRDALVAVCNPAVRVSRVTDPPVTGSSHEWVLGPDVATARRAAGSVQGRKSTVPVSWPVEIDPSHEHTAGLGDFVRTLRTTWVEPAYLEPDAVWCIPGGEPVGPLVNGGAFGGKSDSRFVDEVRATARRLADVQGRAVRMVLSREDIVRLGPKRPPVALGVRADGSGMMWAVRTPGLRETIAKVAPDWELIEVDVPVLPTSMQLRAAGWAEIAVARSSVVGEVEMPGGSRGDHVIAPNGAEAWARVELVEDPVHRDMREPGTASRERIVVRVKCGDPLDMTVLRSYCVGAAHMALGWVRSEGIAVTTTAQGELVPVDLTIRSFGVLRAVDTPEIVIEIDDESGTARRADRNGSDTRGFGAVNGSDAVFAAVAAAVWRHDGFPSTWPSQR